MAIICFLFGTFIGGALFDQFLKLRSYFENFQKKILSLIWNVPSWNIENCWNFSPTCLILWDISVYFCKNGSRTPCIRKMMFNVRWNVVRPITRRQLMWTFFLFYSIKKITCFCLLLLLMEMFGMLTTQKNAQCCCVGGVLTKDSM